MTDFQDPNFQAALVEQLTESLQATAILTQGLQELQEEVGEHSGLLTQFRAELQGLTEKLGGLVRLVQGEGLADSITSAIIELQTKVAACEQWRRDFREDKRENKTTNTTVLVLIASSLAAIISAIGASVIPTLIR